MKTLNYLPIVFVAVLSFSDANACEPGQIQGRGFTNQSGLGFLRQPATFQQSQFAASRCDK